MKKKGKYVLVIGAVVVVLLMISSACAVNVIQSETKKRGEAKDDIYIDPTIYLTNKHLSLFKKAVTHIEDPTYKMVVAKIIEQIEKKGQVTSTDVKRIIYETNLDVNGVYFMKLIRADGYGSPRNTFCFPGTFLALAWLTPYWGPVLFGKWDLKDTDLPTNEHAHLYIGLFGEKGFFGGGISTESSGLVIGGVTLPGFAFGSSPMPFSQRWAGGFYTLAFIST